MKLDTRNLGYEHNELDLMARRLEKDGKAYAAEYRDRADEARKVYDHIADLGRLGNGARGTNTDVGVEIIDWLLAHDWTPPTYLPISEVGR